MKFINNFVKKIFMLQNIVKETVTALERVDRYSDMIILIRVADLLQQLDATSIEALKSAVRSASARISKDEIKSAGAEGTYRPIDLSRARDKDYNPYASRQVEKVKEKVKEVVAVVVDDVEISDYPGLLKLFGSVEAIQEFISEKVGRKITTLNEEKLLKYYQKVV